MWEVLKTAQGEAVLWGALGFMLILVAAYLISRWRGENINRDEPVSSELLSQFKDIHAQGDLSDDEFRSIKTKLSTSLQQEVKDSEKAT